MLRLLNIIISFGFNVSQSKLISLIGNNGKHKIDMAAKRHKKRKNKISEYVISMDCETEILDHYILSRFPSGS